MLLQRLVVAEEVGIADIGIAAVELVVSLPQSKVLDIDNLDMRPILWADGMQPA